MTKPPGPRGAYFLTSAMMCFSLAAGAQQSTRTPTVKHPIAISRDTAVVQHDFRSLHVIQAGQLVRTLPAGAAISYQPGQFIAQKTGDSPRLEVRERRVGMFDKTHAETVTVLPYRYEGQADDKHHVRLHPAIFTEPLRYEGATHQFNGTLLIALEDEDVADQVRQLSGPIPITIASAGDEVTPSDLSVLHTNLPAMRVAVLARDPVDSVRLQIIPNFDLRGVAVWLPVTPTLVIPNARSTAPGLGVSTTPLNIVVRGKVLRDSVRVLLATTRGSLSTQQVVIPPGGIAHVELRSEGVGSATVTASALGTDSAETTVIFTWPVLFVVLAIAGGALGGLTATVSRKRRARTGATRPILVGALIGFVVAIVYRALNINLTGFQLPVLSSDEAAVFAFALLGGAFGIPTLAHSPAAKRVFPKSGRSED